MCYRPLHITSNNVYRNSNVSACTYDVPCGKCEACRDQYRNMWKCRLWHELSYTYSHGGVAVFLTFTYRDNCLPSICLNGVDIPCFNHQDVKTFLNRLKVSCYRLYGKSSYKYFIAMEYGKNTKRQHLHGLFFLSSSVNWREFVELCRSLWSHGFMFPKFKNGCYIKDDGSDDTPTIRDAVKGSVYVSKYVTKDLSFYGIPSVSSAVDADPAFALHFGPKHYQSNGLGLSILDGVDLSDKTSALSFLTDGISVPYSKSKIPVPRYIKKKLLFKNVKSDRYGSKGSLLYDSFPTSLNYALRTLLYERKASKLIDGIKKIYARYKSLYPDVDIPANIDYNLLANYILYFHNVNNNVLHSFLYYYDADLSSFSDISKVGFFYNLSKDNNFLKHNQYVTDQYHSFPYSSVFNYSLLNAYRLYVCASSICEELQTSEFYSRSVSRDDVRYKYFYSYDKKLC